MTLARIQSSDIEGQPPRILEFLEWLAARPSNDFMSLFAGTGQAAEKEVITYQTIKAMVNNYHQHGQLFSVVGSLRDSSLAKNRTAFNWLVQNNYLTTEDGKCAITQLMVAKLYVHFANELMTHPTAIEGF